jgi:hypothetical protein
MSAKNVAVLVVSEPTMKELCTMAKLSAALVATVACLGFCLAATVALAGDEFSLQETTATVTTIRQHASSTIVVSADGAHTAFVAKRDKAVAVVVDGVAGSTFESVSEPVFAPDGTRFVSERLLGTVT